MLANKPATRRVVFHTGLVLFALPGCLLSRHRMLGETPHLPPTTSAADCQNMAESEQRQSVRYASLQHICITNLFLCLGRLSVVTPMNDFACVRAGRNGLARISAQQPRRPSLNLPRGGPGPQPGPSIQKPEIAPAQLQRSSGKALVIGRPILEGSSIGEDRDGSLRQLTEAELPERIPELRLIQSAK